MATAEVTTERPGSPEEAAELLRSLGEAGKGVRPRGGGTKLDWGGIGEPVAVELETGGMAKILEHNVGDLTAVLQAGVPLAEAQAAFAEEGQMLALDPPLGAGDAATVGGMVATGDSGPLRHRYGGVRDLIVGISLALSDGTLAKAGSKVIKNVAGYDLAKLFTGSHGTLGLIVTVTVRLHPKPVGNATAVGASDDPDVLGEGRDPRWRACRSRPTRSTPPGTTAPGACSRASAARPRPTRRRRPPSGCATPGSTACRPSRTTRSCGPTCAPRSADRMAPR